LTKIYLPDVENQEVPSFILESTLFQLIRDSEDQQRDKSKMELHLLLNLAAQTKANDMANLSYFAHTSPSGVSANQNVRNTGYPLPSYYPKDGNNVESLYIGSDNPADAAAAWLTSDHHRVHVYGQDSFFGHQNCIGVGFSPVPKEKHRGYWVFISAPCP